MMISRISHLLLCSLLLAPITAFHTTPSNSRVQSTSLHATVDRRALLTQGAAAAASCLLVAAAPVVAGADTDVVAPIEMKNFIDPVGYFSITIPKSYFALRRSAKGDLPDAKTGQGRRGSSIFTAGDMGKAIVVAVERFPTRVLLEDNGIEASGDLSTFPKLGKAGSIATLINLRREKDKPGQSKTEIVDPVYSADGKTLTFALRTEIDVQKPELLMEQYGVDRLFRKTLAKATLDSNDDNIMAVFGSALEMDFTGPDGEALKQSVESFGVNDQSKVAAAAP